MSNWCSFFQDEVEAEDESIGDAIVSSQEAYFGIITMPTVVIHPLNGCK